VADGVMPVRDTGSRNFIRLVSMKVMLKYTVLWKTGSQCLALGWQERELLGWHYSFYATICWH